MKKFILAIALLATVSTSLVSCSADDSELQSVNNGSEQMDGIPILPPVIAKP